MRKLFRETRRKFGARTAVRLFRVTLSIHPVTKKQQIATENEITKNDNQICNTISNGASLRIQIHPSNREVYTIFVTLPNEVNKTFLLEEVKIAIYSYNELYIATMKLVTIYSPHACMLHKIAGINCLARKHRKVVPNSATAIKW